MLFTVLCATAVIVGAFIAGLALAIAPDSGPSQPETSTRGDANPWPAVACGAVAVIVGLTGLLIQFIADWG